MWEKTSSFMVGADVCVEMLTAKRVKSAYQFWTFCGPYKIDWVGDEMNDWVAYLTVSAYNEAKEPKVQLFGGHKYLPSYAYAVGPGEYLSKDLISWGMYYKGAAISSLRVPRGLVVELCKKDYFVDCMTVNEGETKSLPGTGWNDETSSLRVMRNQ
jgi:hypothetical protein